jgi:hypothetical protein
VWKCPPSIVLPQIDDDERSPMADRGVAIHAFLERCRVIGVEAAIAEAPAELELLLRCINIDELPTHLATEVAFLYDYKARTAREIGRNIGRDYAGHLRRTGQAPIGDAEIALTIDLVGCEPTRPGQVLGYVGDYKTGWTKYPAPDRFGQTLLAALCVRHVYKCDRVVLELLYVRSDGDHYAARRTCDDWDLDIFADELAAAMDLVDHAAAEYQAGRGLMLTEGPHCDHCPAYKQCPAKIALVRSIPAELAAIEASSGAMSRERAAEIWLVCERIGEVLSRVKDEICMMAAHNPIELADGRVIGRLVTEREGLNGQIVADVLTSWYGREAADAVVELRATKKSLVEELARRKAEGEVMQSKKGTGLVDRVLEEIRKRGGIEISTSDSVKPHVPRKRLKAAP